MFYTADQIREITEINIRDTYEETLDQIFKACVYKAKDNGYEATLYGIDIDDTLKMYLETLGYKLRKDENKINYIISW